MTAPYTIVQDLAHQMEPPVDGTLSRTIHQDDRLKAILFHFSTGQELSEHTASTPAVMHFLEGDADVTLGGDVAVASAGTFFICRLNFLTAFRPRRMLSCCSC